MCWVGDPAQLPLNGFWIQQINCKKKTKWRGMSFVCLCPVKLQRKLALAKCLLFQVKLSHVQEQSFSKQNKIMDLFPNKGQQGLNDLYFTHTHPLFWIMAQWAQINALMGYSYIKMLFKKDCTCCKHNMKYIIINANPRLCLLTFCLFQLYILLADKLCVD